MVDSARRGTCRPSGWTRACSRDGSRHEVFKRWFEPERSPRSSAAARSCTPAVVRRGAGVRVLVIGGTVFLGRAIVEAALDRADEVTYFHRGRHGRGLHTDAEEVLGDRATDLDRLPGGAWDTVIDTCGFDPALVGAAARTLSDRAAHYVLRLLCRRSTAAGLPPRSTRTAPCFDGDEQEYGPLKAAAERAAEAAMPGRVLHVRAGVIVGPHENIGRLPYWLRRMRRGGDVLAPGAARRGRSS